MMKQDHMTTTTMKRQAKASLKRIRALLADRPSPFSGLTAHGAIERIRKIREELWEEKFAPRA